MLDNISKIQWSKLHTGRIGRYDYFLGTLVLMVPMVIFCIIFLLPLIIMDIRLEPGTSGSNLFELVFFIVLTTQYYILTSLSIRRYHDLGMSGFNAILLFIPIISIILHLYLLFVAGDDKENEYGLVYVRNQSLIKEILSIKK